MTRSLEDKPTQRALGKSLETSGTHGRRLRVASLAKAKKTLTICPYCSVGCGMVVHSVDNEIINVEGDPANPVNEGALCAKGAAARQLVHNPERLLKPTYRAPNTTRWQEVEGEWVLDRIARRVKASRDRTFQLTTKSIVKVIGPDGRETETDKECVVNMTDGMASIGSCSIINEECYLLQRLMRSWGIVHFDDKTRT